MMPSMAAFTSGKTGAQQAIRAQVSGSSLNLRKILIGGLAVVGLTLPWLFPDVGIALGDPDEKKVVPFTMQSTPSCATVLDDSDRLEQIVRVALKDWFYASLKKAKKYTPSLKFILDDLAFDMKQAEQHWKAALSACHGPLPTNSRLTNKLTLRYFTQGFAKCASAEERRTGGHPSLFSGEFCVKDWHDQMKKAWKNSKVLKEGESDARDSAVDQLVIAAQCALRMEFALDRTAAGQPRTRRQQTNRQKRPGWQPKRIIFLTPTLGNQGALMGCPLAATGYGRGWEIVFVEGEYRGFKYKYTDTLSALRLVVARSQVAAEDTLVVFGDSKDMLVNQGPEVVAEAFLDMTTDFVFSSEPLCFPMAQYPHSFGLPMHVCDGSFPKAQRSYAEGHKFVNTGGWIGTASAAFEVLQELSKVVQDSGPYVQCLNHGTDQLLGNAAYLRNPTRIGLDVEYDVFASDAWHLIGKKLKAITVSKGSKNKGYCHASKFLLFGPSKKQCPALLHFNGGGEDPRVFDTAYKALKSSSTIKECKPGGQIVIADLERGVIRREDFKEDPRWAKCRKDNACA